MQNKGIIVDLLDSVKKMLNAVSNDFDVIFNDLSEKDKIASEETKGDKQIILVITLINLSKDTSKADAIGENHINLTLLFSAHTVGSTSQSDVYLEEVDAIEQVIKFFTLAPSFSYLQRNILAELVNMDTREISSLWSVFGVKLKPSVVYRFRTLVID